MINKDLLKKTEGVLLNYKTIKAEINNLLLEIEDVEAEYKGVSELTYGEKTGATNKVNSSVENEVLNKIKIVENLTREMESKKRLISKIDNAMATLEETEKRIIELRCFEGYNWNKVGMILNMDGDYCCRIKRAAINKILPLVWVFNKYAN